jgi:hypothetical protein
MGVTFSNEKLDWATEAQISEIDQVHAQEISLCVMKMSETCAIEVTDKLIDSLDFGSTG